MVGCPVVFCGDRVVVVRRDDAAYVSKVVRRAGGSGILLVWSGNRLGYGWVMTMTDMVVLDVVPFRVAAEALFERLHVASDGEDAGAVRRLIGEAERVGRPKAMYRMAYIDEKGEDEVVIGGVRLSSRVLRVNLDKVHRVFPYVATCGVELEAWSATITDELERFWADAIKEAALRAVMSALIQHMKRHFANGTSSTMNPGSLGDWPLREQRGLFEILGDVRATVGVELTRSLLMVPTKSVSGIRFATEAQFENCQLCPRENCPGRRAQFEPNLYGQRYGKA